MLISANLITRCSDLLAARMLGHNNNTSTCMYMYTRYIHVVVRMYTQPYSTCMYVHTTLALILVAWIEKRLRLACSMHAIVSQYL